MTAPRTLIANADSMQVRLGHRLSTPGNLLRKQHGATLLVGMIFLAILTMLGLSAALINKSDERMARNSRDHNIAFFAAESALRDARADLQRTNSRIQGATGATGDCSLAAVKGLCLPAITGTKQVWDRYLEDPQRSVEYGEMTGLSVAQKFQLAPSPGGVTAQPRYLLEVLPNTFGVSLSAKKPQKWTYRITAIGYGSNAGTQVLVQEVFRLP